MMGIYAYRVTSVIDKQSNIAKLFFPGIAVIAIISLAFLGLGPRTKDGGSLDIILWGLGFMALVIWQALAPSKAIANKFLDFVGERSFSIYLLHPIVTHFSKDALVEAYNYTVPFIGNYSYFTCGALLIAAILAISEITYRLIEVPGIGLGRSIIQSRKSTHRATAEKSQELRSSI